MRIYLLTGFIILNGYQGKIVTGIEKIPYFSFTLKEHKGANIFSGEGS
ncbi:MAG: hypothetical protein OEV42_19935 [Deltaproteobacteria bacterium]|nr:hypothetical protein [Deltaproteobacteria bacterium]